MEEKFKVKHLNPIMTSIMAPIVVSLVVSLMTSIEDRGGTCFTNNRSQQ